jgi:hypothetical protein
MGDSKLSPEYPGYDLAIESDLQKLQEAGLVASKLELSSDGKALNYFEVVEFNLALTPSTIVKAVRSLAAAPTKSD